jgi:hypothetical protein
MYGRAGDLAKLNRDRNNIQLPNIVRLRADRAHATIVAQLKDKKLMRLRERLINATRAGDEYEARKIEIAMRAHRQEDQETGT